MVRLIRGRLFWAYLDDEGKIYIKNYIGDRHIANYEALPFCKGIFGPFEAFDINHARELVRERYAMEMKKQ